VSRSFSNRTLTNVSEGSSNDAHRGAAEPTSERHGGASSADDAPQDAARAKPIWVIAVAICASVGVVLAGLGVAYWFRRRAMLPRRALTAEIIVKSWESL
jgi:hypothetical protein